MMSPTAASVIADRSWAALRSGCRKLLIKITQTGADDLPRVLLLDQSPALPAAPFLQRVVLHQPCNLRDKFGWRIRDENILVRLQIDTLAAERRRHHWFAHRQSIEHFQARAAAITHR